MTAAPGKPLEIEGFFDLHLYTPLGGAVARLLARTRVTPNQVSWASVAVAGLAAIAYTSQTLPAAMLGAVLLLGSGILDSADGQLARLTGQTSELGETLDGLCDTLSFALIYVVAAIGLVSRGGPLGLAAGLLAAAAWSHSVQSSLVDFERQVFAHLVYGSTRIAREDPVELTRACEAAVGEGWWPHLLRTMRIAYCERQRRWLASTTALLAAYHGLAPDHRAAFAGRYRDAACPQLKWWAVLAPNSHTLGIMLAGLAPFLVANATVAQWGLALAFAFDLALNVPMLALIAVQRRMDERLLAFAPDDTIGAVAISLGATA